MRLSVSQLSFCSALASRTRSMAGQDRSRRERDPNANHAFKGDLMNWTPEKRLKLISQASANAEAEIRAGRLLEVMDRLSVINLLASQSEAFLNGNAAQINEFVSRPANTERNLIFGIQAQK